LKDNAGVWGQSLQPPEAIGVWRLRGGREGETIGGVGAKHSQIGRKEDGGGRHPMC